MLIAIYHILKDNVPFHDLGADYYNQFNKDSKIRAYLKKLHALGGLSRLPRLLRQCDFITSLFMPANVCFWGKGNYAQIRFPTETMFHNRPVR